ncbi:hypothetical protein [Leptospira borgpetersenii]|uniref:hypothetical protein n=1 Tax=Leptospira borgpetersenii TaxID=174 RepID=UPI000774B3E3
MIEVYQTHVSYDIANRNRLTSNRSFAKNAYNKKEHWKHFEAKRKQFFMTRMADSDHSEIYYSRI